MPYGYYYLHPEQLRWMHNYSYHPSAWPSHLPVYEYQQPLTFVLIHGSWADTSFWDGIASELRRNGHSVYVPEYPGHGSDPNKAVTHSMISQSVADYISSHQLHGIILIGHSFGGTVIQKVTELIPDRIRRLVFLDAFVLKDGESLNDALPPAVQEAFQQLRENSGSNTIMLPYPLFRETFVNLADAQLAGQMYSLISPEPAAPFYEKLDLKKFYSLPIPRSYVYLTEDNVLPQGVDYSFHPHLSSRLGIFRLIKGHGDHMSTAKTEPRMVADKLYKAARD